MRAVTYVVACSLAVGLSPSTVADQPLPPPTVVEACSPDGRYCARADPAARRTTVRVRATGAELWSLPEWHRYFFLADGGDVIVIGPDSLNLLPRDVKGTEPILRFLRRGQPIRAVLLRDLFPSMELLQRTVSHLHWGHVVGFNSGNQIIVALADGRRLAFGAETGLGEPERKK